MFWKDVSQLQANSFLVIVPLVEYQAGATCSGGMHLHLHSVCSTAVMVSRKNNAVTQSKMQFSFFYCSPCTLNWIVKYRVSFVEKRRGACTNCDGQRIPLVVRF